MESERSQAGWKQLTCETYEERGLAETQKTLNRGLKRKQRGGGQGGNTHTHIHTTSGRTPGCLCEVLPTKVSNCSECLIISLSTGWTLLILICLLSLVPDEGNQWPSPRHLAFLHASAISPHYSITGPCGPTRYRSRARLARQPDSHFA